MKFYTLYTLIMAVLLAAFTSKAVLITERFTNDPAIDGWQVYGDTNLFQWDAINHNLDVTWDSSQTNSYFFHSLGGIYSKTNDFLVLFDLNLKDIAVGTTPGKPYTFEIAAGLINTRTATNGAYLRGFGYFPNIVEFDYFPNDINDFGATVSTLIISSQTNYSLGGFTDPLEMETGTVYHVVMYYAAASQILYTTMAADGAPFGPIENTYLDANFDDFQVDAFSLNSYNDDGQNPFGFVPDFSGSILVHGTVSKFAFASPLPVGLVKAISAGRVQFGSDTNWLYTLEQTADLQTWSVAAPTIPGNGTNLILQATNPPPDKSFYRVSADLP